MKATKREILSLVGSLQHDSKVVQPGRTFTARMFSAAAKVKELQNFTCLNQDFLSNLHWWHTFINSWNGVSFLRLAHLQTTFDCHSIRLMGMWRFFLNPMVPVSLVNSKHCGKGVGPNCCKLCHLGPYLGTETN